ncbi:LOW QUALITY PROTEIN: D-alanyl-D-alanine carboxypeptidase [Bacillus sp. JCM 19045]|nr:LOW QUALITY PROTEIN: D-alanyl-D-alanine carboxypeptidase [Bacillus sp. JCM 19045]
MKRKWVLVGLISFLIAMNSQSAFAKEVVSFPVSGQAAVLMEQESGRVLYGKNEHQPLKIASITKIMTAIIAIESGKMDENLVVSKNAEGTEGSSLYLVAGEKLLLEDLVYGLMLRSGNDAAMAIAEHVGGSTEGFVYLMNEKAEEIGMTNSLFRNPHGLDTHPDHLSSAFDMALLTQYAMENDTYRKIASTKVHRSQGENVRVHNKNRLLTEKYSYSTGGKTGYTKLAKRTLVSTASKDGLDLITVTLNDPNDWDDHMNLFNWGFDQFILETLAKKGELKSRTDDFYQGKLMVPYDLKYPLSAEEKNHVTPSIELVEPPKNGELTEQQVKEPVGKLSFEIDNQVIESTPLYYKEEVKEEPSFWDKMKQMISFIGGVSPS